MKNRRIFRERLRRNPKFRSARQEFLKMFPDYPHGVWTEDLIKNLDKFITEWGTAPIDPDSKEFEKDPLYYYQQVGKDGAFLIRVYPWTTEEEICNEFKKIRESFQPEQTVVDDSEIFKKVVDLVNRGEEFHEIGRQVFRDSLNERGQQELVIDMRFEQLINLFKSDELNPDEAGEKAMNKLRHEEIYLKLGYPYKPGDRTRNLEKKAGKIYEMLKPGLE